MNRISATWCILALCFALAGCGKTEYSDGQRFPLSGKVTYDGHPIDEGTISFLPQGGSQRVSGGPIVNGTYTVPEPQGANAGKYRVEIHWNKPTGKKADPGAIFSEQIGEVRAEGLPPKYHTESQLAVDVPSADNAYNFDLEK